jgi:hypothetical protein
MSRSTESKEDSPHTNSKIIRVAVDSEGFVGCVLWILLLMGFQPFEMLTLHYHLGFIETRNR